MLQKSVLFFVVLVQCFIPCVQEDEEAELEVI